MNIKKTLSGIYGRAVIGDAISATGWSIVGKGVGFIATFFIAAWFGVTAEIDIFFFSYAIIIFFSTLFGSVVESVIVPYIAEVKSQNEDAGRFVGGILGLSGIGLLTLTGLLLLVINPILSLITRFDPQSLDLAFLILIQTSPLIILLVWTSILAGTLNAYKRFVFPAVSPAFRAVVNIGFIFIFKESLGVHAIGLGYVTGEVVRLMVLAAVIKRSKLFKLTLGFNFDSKLKEFLKISYYQIIGMAAVGLTPVVDRTMALWLDYGSVSALEYAGRLHNIPMTLMSRWGQTPKVENDVNE